MIGPAIMPLDRLGDVSIIELSILVVMFLSLGRMMLSLGHSTSFCQERVDNQGFGLEYTQTSFTTSGCKIVVLHRHEHEGIIPSSVLRDSICTFFLADND
jgi:predicted site-specific integrase-resolvase